MLKIWQIYRINFLNIKIYIHIVILKNIKALKPILIFIAAKLIEWLINHNQLYHWIKNLDIKKQILLILLKIAMHNLCLLILEIFNKIFIIIMIINKIQL